MLGVGHRDDGVQPQRLAEFRALEGLRHRQRIGDPCRLDQDMVDRLATDIREGRLRPGTRLPTHRDLASREGLALVTATRVYTIRNADTSERRVVVEHPIRAGWKLAGGGTPAESTADAYRFVVTVPAAATESLTVTEQQQVLHVAAAIAQVLFLAEGSVEKVIHSIFLKLGITWEPTVHKRVKAVILYLAETDT